MHFTNSSCTASKIDLLDSLDVVTKKIRKAEAAPKVVEENGLISMVEFTFLPVSSLKGKKEFRVPRKDEEDLVYTDIEAIKSDYVNDVVSFWFIFLLNSNMTNNSSPVNPTTTKGRCYRRPDRIDGTYPGCLPSR